jgi:hypothetical protein
MSGDGELRMPVDAVHRHAASVGGAADAMDTGRAAAAQVRLDGQAYGEICSFLPALVESLADRTVTALGESASALRETSTRLRSAATAAASADTAAAQHTTAAGRPIELPL